MLFWVVFLSTICLVLSLRLMFMEFAINQSLLIAEKHLKQHGYWIDLLLYTSAVEAIRAQNVQLTTEDEFKFARWEEDLRVKALAAGINFDPFKRPEGL